MRSFLTNTQSCPETDSRQSERERPQTPRGPTTSPHFGGADGPLTPKETSRQEKTVPLTTSCGPTAESSSLETAWVLVPAQKGYVHKVSQGQEDRGLWTEGHRASSQQE